MILVTVTIPGALREETLQAIHDHWLGEHRIHTIQPGDSTGYQRILTDYWEAQEDFCVIEPDIVINQNVSNALLTCDCGYGCFPYAWTTNIGPALGCTWFRQTFLQAYPDAMKQTAARGVTWRQLDVILMRHVLAKTHGCQPHIHLPEVQHLNPNKQLLKEASREPLTYVPDW